MLKKQGIKNNMLFISYYTPGNYEKVMKENLLPSLEKWDLKYYVEEVRDRGDWWKNTAFKATFIRKCLKEFQEDIVFIDADAVIESEPYLFYCIPDKYDIAIHYLDWYKQWRNQSGGDKFELLSGTMMFRFNKKVLKLVEQYKEMSDLHIGKFEQKILEEIIAEKDDLQIFELPAVYCAVINHDNKLPNYIKDPVIVHKQASRKFKNK